jgi:tRNA threonylcarbamoyl adenosine modification protein (Sua5/YciO/YrdC/YwlC family)
VDGDQVDEVVAALASGGVVVLPTDTVYGLAALATDRRATDHLFALKGRSGGVPLAVLCASAEQALALTDPDVAPAVTAVADRWWPGPLTLVLTRRAGVGLHLGEPATTVGVRVPDDDLVRAVAARLGPIAATSANRHGQPAAETADVARETLGDGVVLVVDGGRRSVGSSTVIDTTTTPWRVLREGPVSGADVLATARDAAG